MISVLRDPCRREKSLHRKLEQKDDVWVLGRRVAVGVAANIVLESIIIRTKQQIPYISRSVESSASLPRRPIGDTWCASRNLRRTRNRSRGPEGNKAKVIG